MKILKLQACLVEVEIFCVLMIGFIFVFIDRLKGIRCFAKRCHKTKGSPTIPSNNILFIQIYGIGNFILSSTTQVAIREHFPQKKIFAIVHPAIKELAEKSPYIDKVIVYQDRRLRGKIRLIKELRKTNFALAIDLSGTYWTAWLTRLSLAPKRIGFNAVGVKRFASLRLASLRLGFNLDGSGGLYTSGIPFNHDIHMKEFYEQFLTILNIPLKDRDLKIFPSVQDDKFAEEVLKGFGKSHNLNEASLIIAIHIGARQKERLWDSEKFSSLINELLKKEACLVEAKIILLGSKEDIEKGNQILSLVSPEDRKDKAIISMVGKITISQLASIISKSHLFIGHDSGPMHIACAVKTPTVALFGPGVVELWRPWLEKSVVVQSQIPCCGCNKIGHFYKCRENICMSRISVEEVLRAVEKLW
ncbi:MAG: glycosyltransferase family 9 protein [Nitrospirota bacterium]